LLIVLLHLIARIGCSINVLLRVFDAAQLAIHLPISDVGLFLNSYNDPLVISRQISVFRFSWVSGCGRLTENALHPISNELNAKIKQCSSFTK
jgi:hypothetical protein